MELLEHRRVADPGHRRLIPVGTGLRGSGPASGIRIVPILACFVCNHSGSPAAPDSAAARPRRTAVGACSSGRAVRRRADGRDSPRSSEPPPAGPSGSPSAASPDRGRPPRRLGHAQRVAGLVEVAVMAEIAVVDRAAVDRVAGRPGRPRLAEPTARPPRVVGPPARRAAERLVGPGDRLEPAFRVGRGAAAVRVEGPGQPPEGDLDLGVGRRPRDAERGVVIGPGRRRPSARQAGPRDDASAARAARDVSPIARLMCAPSGVNGSRSWLQRSIAIRA